MAEAMRERVVPAYAKASAEELKRIAELRAQGQPFALIAERLGSTVNSVRHLHRRATGIIPKPREDKGQRSKAPSPAATTDVEEPAMPKRNGECLPAQHPETWGAVMATFSAEWRCRHLEA